MCLVPSQPNNRLRNWHSRQLFSAQLQSPGNASRPRRIMPPVLLIGCASEGGEFSKLKDDNNWSCGLASTWPFRNEFLILAVLHFGTPSQALPSMQGALYAGRSCHAIAMNAVAVPHSRTRRFDCPLQTSAHQSSPNTNLESPPFTGPERTPAGTTASRRRRRECRPCRRSTSSSRGGGWRQ
jgi:hypothetical protein